MGGWEGGRVGGRERGREGGRQGNDMRHAKRDGDKAKSVTPHLRSIVLNVQRHMAYFALVLRHAKRDGDNAKTCGGCPDI